MSLSSVKNLMAVALLVSACAAAPARAQDEGVRGWFHSDLNVFMTNATLNPIPGTSRVVFAHGKQVKSLAEERKLIARQVPMCTLSLKSDAAILVDTFIVFPKREWKVKASDNLPFTFFGGDSSQVAENMKCDFLPFGNKNVNDFNPIFGETLVLLDYQSTLVYLKPMAEETNDEASSQSTRNESGRADESAAIESSSQSSAGSARN